MPAGKVKSSRPEDRLDLQGNFPPWRENPAKIAKPSYTISVLRTAKFHRLLAFLTVWGRGMDLSLPFILKDSLAAQRAGEKLQRTAALALAEKCERFAKSWRNR